MPKIFTTTKNPNYYKKKGIVSTHKQEYWKAMLLLLGLYDKLLVCLNIPDCISINIFLFDPVLCIDIAIVFIHLQQLLHVICIKLELY